MRQTLIIIVVTLVILVGFVTVGIPTLINFAVALGNSKASSKISLQEDTLPPLPPQLSTIPEATKDTALTITGFAEAGSLVYLYQNSNKIAETTADNQGNFTFADVQLENGSNHFVATATDQAKNQSQQSMAQTIVFDNEAPSLTIEAPADGARVFGLLQQLTDVRGATDPGVQVTLNDRQLVVTGDGSFSTKYQLEEGEHTLKFVAKDKAGNETIKEIKVTFSK